MGNTLTKNEIVERVQAMWDKRYKGLKFIVIEDGDYYLMGWELKGSEYKANSPMHSVQKGQIDLESRWIAVDMLKYMIDMLEHEFKEFAIKETLKKYE